MRTKVTLTGNYQKRVFVQTAEHTVELLNHTALISKFTSYAKSISFFETNAPDVKYILSETEV